MRVRASSWSGAWAIALALVVDTFTAFWVPVIAAGCAVLNAVKRGR